MKYAIDILQTEKYRLKALVRQIESNEHQCFQNIPHEKEINNISELDRAIVRLKDAAVLAATDSQQAQPEIPGLQEFEMYCRDLGVDGNQALCIHAWFARHIRRMR